MICANRIMFVYSSKKLTNAMPVLKKVLWKRLILHLCLIDALLRASARPNRIS